MFTGIIEQVGRVRSLDGFRLEVDADFADVRLGESIAVNGCCLTVVGDAPLAFDLSEETLRKTSLGDLQTDSQVNLERAMMAGDRFGGHVVQGHVDTTTEIDAFEVHEGSTMIRFRVPGDGRYMIEKGSITLDGISLTIVNLQPDTFEVWIIPHTWTHTNLHRRLIGDRVNVEFDMIAKYLERLATPNRT